jgi:hypothetical protein
LLLTGGSRESDPQNYEFSTALGKVWPGQFERSSCLIGSAAYLMVGPGAEYGTMEFQLLGGIGGFLGLRIGSVAKASPG